MQPFPLDIPALQQTMVDNYLHFLKLQAGHQCFSNSGCRHSGMNSYAWTTFPLWQFIQQMRCHLSVTGQGLANAWCATWPDHPSFHVRWMGVSATCTTCVRQIGRVPIRGVRRMAAESCVHTIIQLAWCMRGCAKKLKKVTFYKFYFLSQSCNWKPILPKVILNVNHSLKQLNAILTPPTIIQLFYSNYVSHQFDMSYPYCFWGPSFCFTPVFNVFTMKNKKTV